MEALPEHADEEAAAAAQLCSPSAACLARGPGDPRVEGREGTDAGCPGSAPASPPRRRAPRGDSRWPPRPGVARTVRTRVSVKRPETGLRSPCPGSGCVCKLRRDLRVLPRLANAVPGAWALLSPRRPRRALLRVVKKNCPAAHAHQGETILNSSNISHGFCTFFVCSRNFRRAAACGALSAFLEQLNGKAMGREPRHTQGGRDLGSLRHTRVSGCACARAGV